MNTKIPEGMEEVSLGTPRQRTMQVGIKEGRIVIGADGKPIAAFYPEQAAALGCMLIKHALTVAMGGDMVKEALDKEQPLPESEK